MFDVTAEEYDGLVLPGGLLNPDTLRQNTTAVDFVRDFFQQGKPVAAICHGPWMLVEADVLHGRTLTSWPSLKTDIRNAGGGWIDRDVVVDEGLVTSRKPDDLDAFCERRSKNSPKAGTWTSTHGSNIPNPIPDRSPLPRFGSKSTAGWQHPSRHYLPNGSRAALRAAAARRRLGSWCIRPGRRSARRGGRRGRWRSPARRCF